MRKSIITIISMLTFFIAEASAYEMYLNPWQGGFGLNMAVNNYDYVAGQNIEYSLGSTGGSADRSNYSDNEIIGIVGVLNIDASVSNPDPDQSMIISASCPGGFYFTSRSNPDAKRPFEIWVKPSYSWSDDDNSRSESGQTIRGNVVRLGTNSENEIDEYTYPEMSGGQSKATWPDYEYIDHPIRPDEEHNKYRYIWCDLVICLPFESVSSTGVLTVLTDEGVERKYNLIEANDYNAVVTISITYNGETQHLTIPLSGFYSRNMTSADDSASLSIRTLPKAMNLNIGGTRRMERVAEVDFLVNQTKYTVTEKWVWDWWPFEGHYEPDELVTGQGDELQYRIFLSASNDPYYSEGRGFELVHSSVNYSEPHTPYNSIGYTARLVDDDSGEYMDFDGTDAITGGSGGIPGVALKQKELHSFEQNTFYQEFHGGVEVLIDEITATGEQEGINKMLSGQYTSTIYVHVVDE